MDIEVDVSNGMPYFNMVGMLSMEIKEAKERIRAALKNSGYELKPSRITVNLSPADKRKEGTLFDLPIAFAILKAAGLISQCSFEEMLVIGELGLSGEVKPVNGILPILMMAKRMGFKRCVLPSGNISETEFVKDIEVIPVDNLKQAVRYVINGEKCKVQSDLSVKALKVSENNGPDFSDIHGHRMAKRAAEIAAAGNHNLLMVGPPGSGKSMIAGRISSIMPTLTYEERIGISTIYSVCGLLKDGNAVTKRPYRAPHHTITVQGMTGGGRYPRPGELSLASGGVLFLDELPEFNPLVIDTLRQPLENKKITLVRASGKYEFAADCMLVAAMNPCKCGYYPDRNRCTCTDDEVRKYMGRISGAILDRMDICVEVPRTEYRELIERNNEECSADIRSRVERAVNIQKERYMGTDIRNNASLSSKKTEIYCKLDKSGTELIKRAFDKFKMSTRGYYKILKVARTIADLAGEKDIKREHVQESVIYRTFDAATYGGR